MELAGTSHRQCRFLNCSCVCPHTLPPLVRSWGSATQHGIPGPVQCKHSGQRSRTVPFLAAIAHSHRGCSPHSAPFCTSLLVCPRHTQAGASTCLSQVPTSASVSVGIWREPRLNSKHLTLPPAYPRSQLTLSILPPESDIPPTCPWQRFPKRTSLAPWLPTLCTAVTSPSLGPTPWQHSTPVLWAILCDSLSLQDPLGTSQQAKSLLAIRARSLAWHFCAILGGGSPVPP